MSKHFGCPVSPSYTDAGEDVAECFVRSQWVVWVRVLPFSLGWFVLWSCLSWSLTLVPSVDRPHSTSIPDRLIKRDRLYDLRQLNTVVFFICHHQTVYRGTHITYWPNAPRLSGRLFLPWFSLRMPLLFTSKRVTKTRSLFYFTVRGNSWFPNLPPGLQSFRSLDCTSFIGVLTGGRSPYPIRPHRHINDLTKTKPFCTFETNPYPHLTKYQSLVNLVDSAKHWRLASQSNGNICARRRCVGLPG